jgi:UDP-N-acetylmuramoylalanine-D-glutamate ligase
MITACVALVGVCVLAIWVSQRGGRLDAVDGALLGVGRTGRAWAAVAAGSDAAAEADAGVVDPAAADAGDAAAPEDVAVNDDDAGTEEVEEEEDAGAVATSPTTKPTKPLPKKKKIRRPRRR